MNLFLDILAIAATLLGGWLLADFLSGVAHWLQDRFGKEDWPIIGKSIIARNRLHHDDPMAFTRGQGFLRRNSTNIIFSLITGALLWWAFGFSLLLAVLIFAGCVSNQVHHWTHVPGQAPRWISFLQRSGLIQSRRHHRWHHVPPHLSHYCILTDWLNPLLDSVRFWSLIEAVLPRSWFAGEAARKTGSDQS